MSSPTPCCPSRKMDRCLAVPLHLAQLHLHHATTGALLRHRKKSKIFTRGKLLLPAMMYCRFHEQQLFRKIERKFSSSSSSFAVIKHLKHSSEKFHRRWSVARFAKENFTSVARAILLSNYLYFPLRTW